MEFGLTQDKWNKLKSLLSCGSKDSSILVSTRDKHVATIMGTCQAHHLGLLSDDDCWSLFKLRAFGAYKEEERPELVAIGKQIVKKCGGSPLAALALGGVMQSRSTEKEWLEVSEKDKEIKKQQLIYLWMSNGFISSRPNLEVEEVGNMVWNELYQKSLFQDVRSDDYSGNNYFKMHDLVHDLAQSISEQGCICLEKQNLNESSRNPHHIGFYDIGENQFKKRALEKAESLRTWYQQNTGQFRFIPTNHSLRVLCTYARKISSFGSLTCLKYLELYHINIKSLLVSICNLRRLEILKLINLSRLRRLPKPLSRIQNLRHLVIEGCDSLSGHSLAELHHLNLGGKLSIKGLQNVESISEAEDAKLKDKQDLGELFLSWYSRSKTKKSIVGAEEVLEALEPHSTVKLLKISYYEGLHWPTWMQNNSATKNLVSLQLGKCQNCQHLPPIGKLP
ncbi:hypothetical protein PIB30_031471 [Stylosanthes scabra]|uniref:NB-ARC domain-containing protein n=1 Tax=Stylosanthes scabra TaxID=79078 RepID=A0ABU6UBA7_9FABA|nr:hypothetical protein [Stylosanthes scabra]